MSLGLTLLAALGLLFFLAIFSGAETGLYSISRVRLQAEAEAGKRSARLLARLLRDDAGLLITLLVGNNLVLELLTRLAAAHVERLNLPDYTHELVATAVLTPAVFLLGELIPKDLFRRRPHLLLGWVAPFVSLFRWVVSPLAWPLTLLSTGLERLFGLRQEDFKRILGRAELVEILAEGRRAGALTHHAEELAQNVLVLRHTPVSKVALGWERVDTLDLDQPESEVRAAVLRSDFTRLPVLRKDATGKRAVVGYLHQLDVLNAQLAGVSEDAIQAFVRPLVELAPELPLDRAMARLQAAGQRVALVGTAAAPRGLVSLMDLLAALAAEPRFSQLPAVARIGGSP